MMRSTRVSSSGVRAGIVNDGASMASCARCRRRARSCRSRSLVLTPGPSTQALWVHPLQCLDSGLAGGQGSLTGTGR